MKRAAILALFATLTGGAILLLSGCESTSGQKMSMASSPGEQEIMCTACFEEIKAVRVEAVKGTRYQLIRKHMCSDCKTEITLYGKDGVAMFKCAKCAPNGVPCDKCRLAKTKS